MSPSVAASDLRTSRTKKTIGLSHRNLQPPHLLHHAHDDASHCGWLHISHSSLGEHSPVVYAAPTSRWLASRTTRSKFWRCEIWARAPPFSFHRPTDKSSFMLSSKAVAGGPGAETGLIIPPHAATYRTCSLLVPGRCLMWCTHWFTHQKAVAHLCAASRQRSARLQSQSPSPERLLRRLRCNPNSGQTSSEKTCSKHSSAQLKNSN